MPVSTGTRLGAYEIIGPLGRGGMSEVYRARDTRLGRDVAIKISAERFGDRFEREARAIAALNHPNICQLYDVGENYLVMELIGGEMLRGPMPIDTALNYAKQIADALEAAHEKGIIHRDLKPANIKVTPEGVVKVLDFGLAKASEEPAAADDPSTSPTMTLSATRAGMILGTAAYMSPEQARGKGVDKRADIWAFGVVLYELLTGRQAFQGETTTDVLAAVMKEEPPLGKLPPHLRPVLERCLRKDPRKRWRDIGDVRMALDEGPLTAETPARRRLWLPWAAAGMLAAALVIAGFALWRTTRPVQLPLIRLNVDLGPNLTIQPNPGANVILSPDGTRVVFASSSPAGKSRMSTRLLSQSQATAISGTEGARADAFFSPDGEWIGFFADGKLKKISLQGGAPVTLCDAPNPRGASWGEDDNIVFAANTGGGLASVSANGGQPRPLTNLKDGEFTHRWPQVLPGAKAVVFTSSGADPNYENSTIEIQSLQSGQRKTLHKGGSYGRFVPTGHLIYMHEGALFAKRFDPERLEVHGQAVPILDDVTNSPVTGSAQLDFSGAASGSGTLAYFSGKGAQTSIFWLESTGTTQPLHAAPGFYLSPRFSPDGKLLVVALFSGNSGLWLENLERDAMLRLTFTAGDNDPVWSPDGRYVAYDSAQTGIFWVRSDGSGLPQRLTRSGHIVFPYSFSPDGKRLAYSELNPQTGFDIWILPLEGDDRDHLKVGTPEPFLRTTANERDPAISPDGRWLAYSSDESGTFEVYAQPFPGPASKWRVSTQGGRLPIWSRSRRELAYQTLDDRIMMVPYSVNGATFTPGTPQSWSDKQLASLLAGANMDLAPDGKRFAVLMSPQAEPRSPTEVTFLLNFFDELRRKVPSGK